VTDGSGIKHRKHRPNKQGADIKRVEEKSYKSPKAARNGTQKEFCKQPQDEDTVLSTERREWEKKKEGMGEKPPRQFWGCRKCEVKQVCPKEILP